jgi:hypothetical protein
MAYFYYVYHHFEIIKRFSQKPFWYPCEMLTFYVEKYGESYKIHLSLQSVLFMSHGKSWKSVYL